MVDYFCPRCENTDVKVIGPQLIFCPDCDLELFVFNFNTIVEDVNRLNEINRNLAIGSGLDLDLINEKIGILVNLYRYKEATEMCENLFVLEAPSIIPNHIDNILINEDVPDDIVCRLEILKAKTLLFLNTGIHKRNLDNEDELFEAAQLYIQSPNFEEDALRCCDLLLKRDGNKTDYLNVMAELYFRTYDYELALNYYNQSGIMKYDDFWLWFNKTRVYLILKNYDKALECGAIAINTQNVDHKYLPELFNMLGLEFDLDNISYLNEHYKKYSISISEMDSLCDDAETLLANNNLQGALAKYDKCILLFDCFSDVWFNKGLIHYHLQQYEQAISCMEKTIGINERASKAWALKAASLLAIEKYRDSKYCAKKALNYDKNDLTAKGVLEFFKSNPLAAL
ncbi:hypothetical protein TL18_08415 [Methanobrevibacter sp. YE315]|uniref:tetratricopeptide repeat protein n=1 Tax=Methanobrevibacter sp. YE315 TaxID=1609968 RepID=UPI000764D71B|nr:tetratricopeptide repeat protein [Methanobrevibacter sp. YE315]AMD18039.1 hypothetical protein TL18_08415 [Methanobrevibacter sp. YE315]